MTARTRAAAFSLAAASALVLGGAAAPAFAGSPSDFCSGDAAYANPHTAGAWWIEVCPNAGYIYEGETANKTDAFDGIGYLTAVGATDVPLIAPASATTAGYVGDAYVASWTDAGVDLGGGTVVDVSVEFTLEGSFARWSISSVEAGTSTPVSIPIEWEGGLGSDGDTLYFVDGDRMISYGDDDDPVLMWSAESDTSTFFDVNDGSDAVLIEAEGAETTITVGMLDYDCATANADAFAYAQTIFTTVEFGSTPVVPGTDDCVVAQPITVAPGAPLDVALDVTITGVTYPDGGDADYWIYDPAFEDEAEIEVTNFNVPDTAPGFRLTGTAPTTPGTYWIGLYPYPTESDIYPVGHLEVIVAATAGPQLAATGSTTPVIGGIAAAVVLAAGAGILVLRRRQTV